MRLPFIVFPWFIQKSSPRHAPLQKCCSVIVKSLPRNCLHKIQIIKWHQESTNLLKLEPSKGSIIVTPKMQEIYRNGPSCYLLVQGLRWKRQNSVGNLFKINNKDTRTTQWRRSGVSIGEFERVNVGCRNKKCFGKLKVSSIETRLCPKRCLIINQIEWDPSMNNYSP